jgi:hypothetical protein
MRSFSLEETLEVVGGQSEQGEDINRTGPVESDGDMNFIGEPGKTDQLGTDLRNGDNQGLRTPGAEHALM